jgi:hypothetical protein
MQKLLEPNTVPPDGYRFFQAETQTWIRAPDYFNLFVNVSEHRKANNLPLGTFWEAEIEDQLCQTLPPGLCKQVKPGEVRNVFSRIWWEEVVQGTQTVVDWAKSGFAPVDQTLANSRADICSRCYYNVQIGGLCAACQHLQNLAARFTGGRKTTSDSFLRACAVCKCSLQVKVWTPIESIDKGTPDTGPYPQFCWVRNELDEFRKQKR